MKDIELKRAISVAPELWATSILPEGILERWIFAEGRPVDVGDPVAVVRIESALHDIMAPAKGRLHIRTKTNAVVEPGSVIGYISREIQGTRTAAPSNDPARRSASA
jgi:pyruvate/2-oxoglutarate dehydrogenase complex dihydrolipoamide acyltransferase (E2) component